MVTIKEVCAILGIAPSTIRLYEKCLPAIPWAIEDNGYRGFLTENIMYLMDCRVMMKDGMPMQEAFDVSMAKSIAAKEEALERQRHRLTEEVRRLSDLMVAVDEQQALVAKISSLAGGYEVVEMPAFFHFVFFNDRILPGLHGLVSRWAAAIPFVSFATHYDIVDYLAGTCPLEETGHAGFMVPLRFSHMVDTSSSCVRLVPAQRCLATVVMVEGVPRIPGAEKLSGGLPRNEEVFSLVVHKLGTCLADEGYSLRGDIYMRLIHAEFPDELPVEANGGKGACYFYVWTPLIEEGSAFSF